METLDGEDNAVLTSEMSKGNDKAAKQYNIVYKYKNPEVDLLWLESEFFRFFQVEKTKIKKMQKYSMERTMTKGQTLL